MNTTPKGVLWYASGLYAKSVATKERLRFSRRRRGRKFRVNPQHVQSAGPPTYAFSTDDAMQQNLKPRVFVSSVIEGFEKFRAIAQEAITEAGGEPLLVNENFPAAASSPRDVCLDAIDSCDAYIVIVGKRGGWTAPSGKLVVEEEYDRAQQRGLPILAFLMRTERNEKVQQLVDRISHYVTGTFRRTFESERELQAEIEQALPSVLATLQRPTLSATDLLNVFQSPYRVRDETTLRFALSPDRREEVVDPIKLGSPEFTRAIYKLAHATDVQLLSYEQSKNAGLEGDSLVILQSNEEQWEGVWIRLELSDSGQLVIDANVTGRQPRDIHNRMENSFVVALEDVEATLRPMFSFAVAFFDEVDRFERHKRFHYDVALSGIGYRTLAKTPKPQPSYSMRMSDSDEPVIVFDPPRLVTRAILRSPSDEIQRVMGLLPRRVGN